MLLFDCSWNFEIEPILLEALGYVLIIEDSGYKKKVKKIKSYWRNR